MTAQAGDTFSLSPAADKQEVRRLLRTRRRNLPPSLRNRAARRAAQKLLGLRLAGKARTVAVYLAVNSELSTVPLIEELCRYGCRVFAPAVDRNDRMRFVPLGGGVRRDALGIPRPAGNRALRDARRFDLVVVPLLAFDARCNRLGAGGGYYDRSFAFRKTAATRPLLIGYAFDAQRIASVPVEAGDVRLDAVVTERRVYRR